MAASHFCGRQLTRDQRGEWPVHLRWLIARLGWTLLGVRAIHRGRVAKAQQAAQALLAVGRRMNDPRSIGFGMQLLGWIALASDDYRAALGFAETGISNACTPWDRESCNNVYCSALVLFNAAVDFAAQRRSAAAPPIARKGSLAKSFELLKEASGNAA
jgi:hypothetical protein